MSQNLRITRIAVLILSVNILFLPAFLQSSFAEESAQLSWDSNQESDLAGYKVYYGESTGIYNGGGDQPSPISLGKTNSHEVTGLTSGKNYFFTLTAVDVSGNESRPSAEVPAVIGGGTNPPPPPSEADIMMNFQPSSASLPSGYQKDTGAIYTATRGYGWDHTIGTRDRNANTDQLLDTFIVSGSATWRYDLPNGTYSVSLASGDASYAAGPHRVLVEGIPVIQDISTKVNEFFTATDVPVTVTDGTLTITIGGTAKSTRLNYVLITLIEETQASNLLTVTVAGNGTVSSSPVGINCPANSCTFAFPIETFVTLTAIPDSGSTFSEWGSGCSGSSISCVVNSDIVQTVTATFVATPPPPVSLSVTLIGNGSVTSTPAGIDCPTGSCSADFPSGTAVTLTAMPANGTPLNPWEGGCSGTDPSCTLTLESAQTVTANFSSAAPPVVNTPVLMNFQPSGASVPTGYQKDTGTGYSASRGYGWDHTISTRDRNKNADQRLDTFIVSEGATWRYDLPNGTYFVSLASGDASYAAGPHRVLVEGIPVIQDISTKVNEFFTVTDVPVTVTDGTLTVTIGGTGKSTRLNYVTIDSTPSPLNSPVLMNFQPSGASVPTGYQKDTGTGYSASRGYGWDHTISTRDRNKNADQRLDTFIVSEGATWRYDLPNGTYFVSLASGDAGYASGPHRVLLEGTPVIQDISTKVNEFFTVTDVPVTVTDGTLTVTIGGTARSTRLNYLIISPFHSLESTGSTLLTEDFNQGNLIGWTVVDEGTHQSPSAWSAATGALVQNSNIYTYPINRSSLEKRATHIFYNDGMSWTNYHLGFSLQSDDNDAVGVMFRYQDSNNYYRFSWDKQRHYRRLVKCENGVFFLLAEDTTIYQQGKTYTIEVDAEDDTLNVLVDGTQVFSVNDTSLSTGTIAFYSWANRGSQFDNVKVENLNVVE